MRTSFLPVVDVPVIIDKFQHFMLYMFMKAPQLLFIDRVVDILVMRAETCTHSANCAAAVLVLCLCLTSVVSASVRHLTLARYTPSTCCVCHPSVVALTLRPHCAVVVFASLCRVVVEVSLLLVLTILLGTV